MGKHNSSVTRVWPVFDCLFAGDPTGASWLPELLLTGSRAGLADRTIRRDPGDLLPQLARFGLALPGSVKKAVGRAQAARITHIRNAYERELPPSVAFLRWLLEHPDRLTWPKERDGSDRVFGSKTQDLRKRLLRGEARVRAEALDKLAKHGANGSRWKWWAFEGLTSADCVLETESLLVLVEGKRTEPISSSTDWFPARNQVIRNVEVANALAGNRNFAVLLCAQTPIELDERAWSDSLPHLTPDAIARLKDHYLGCATWTAVASRLCPTLTLPGTVDEAITTCLGFRS